ncbi:hypothetical protein D3C79_993180 [compost metagenome]
MIIITEVIIPEITIIKEIDELRFRLRRHHTVNIYNINHVPEQIRERLTQATPVVTAHRRHNNIHFMPLVFSQ